MSDWIVLGALTAITYAVSEAVKPRKPKPPAKPRNMRPTTRHAATHLPTRTLHPEFPHRVPVQTTRTEAQNETVQPSKPRGKAHRGTGPFGMPVAQFTKAQKLAMGWNVEEEEEWNENEPNNGWVS